MFGKIRFIFGAFALFSIAACGAANTQSDLPIQGYYWTWNQDGSYGAPTVSEQAISFQTLPNDGKTQVEEPAAPSSQQTIVSGETSLNGFAGGTLTVAALEAATCAQGYCALEGKAPLASSSLTQTGYFSLVVPHNGQHVILKGSHTSADGVRYQGQVYLGVLSTRKDGVALAIQPE